MPSFNCTLLHDTILILNLQVLGAALQKRNLNVQEHVSYSLLNEAGIPTPK